MSDIREDVYKDLHEGQLARDLEMNRNSANVLLDRVQEYIKVTSVLDVGCGLGTWLAIAQSKGFEIAGVEGPWCETDKLEVDKDLVTITDLEKPIELGRKFDLAICLEVGEHLSEAAAPHLVQTLVSHADHVMFSAAVPFQGGHHHVNEKTLGYWVQHFFKHGYRPLDIFRAKIWYAEDIHWWLKQNLVLFARGAAIQGNPKLLSESRVERPLDIIHPLVYLMRCNHYIEHIRKLEALLATDPKAAD
jgi:SAM-dependent methyltransferase